MQDSYEYWHRVTAAVWAAKLRNGQVVGAVEIDSRDVNTDLLPHLPYMTSDARTLDKERGDFRRIDGRIAA